MKIVVIWLIAVLFYWALIYELLEMIKKSNLILLRNK